MLRWLNAGNPSSLYAEGQAAKRAIDEARETVSGALGCEFGELLFTSGGTESAATATLGVALANIGSLRRRVLISAAEHHCVLHSKPMLESLGFLVELIPVDRYARVDLDSLERAMADDVLLVAGMHANNELGTISQPAAIAALAAKHGALYFCDAVQSFGKIGAWVAELGADLISVSAHKIGGPKGVGALFVKAGTKLKPLLAGGGQEREMRAGTENVAAIAGFGAAVKFKSQPQASLRDELLGRLTALGAVSTVPDGVPRLPSHVHVRFPGVPAEALLIVLDRLGVSAGSGAACSSGSIEPSHVMLACGYSEAESKEGLRFTLGPNTTSQEVGLGAERVDKALTNFT